MRRRQALSPGSPPLLRPCVSAYNYIREGGDIYRKSFAIIRAEAALSRFSAAEEKVAVRMIHACGMVELAGDILFSPGLVTAARGALENGAPVFCDANMVASGITRARLPMRNDIICTLNDPRVPGMAKKMKLTRSAAAMECWRERLGGSVVVIGNAPTSLFRLLEMLDEGAPKPAAVIGMPVGFVGAAESKETLAADGRVPFVIVRGRKGGSAMAVAAVNALASEAEL
ncbi:MAG: precorrin-8X methylmutase [Pseudomonadota bacterium]|nr:precorrin-8X methylmutase [Pseudomonadota bacterium]